MTKKLLLFLASAALCLAQVYMANITAAGTGYPAVVTVTATGGGCTTEPTLTGAATSGAVTTITVTFMGIGCTTAPTLSVTGTGGSGSTATAVLLPSTAAILSAVLSNNSGAPDPSGGYTAWNYACILTVSASRTAFYAVGLYPFPGTSQTTLFQNGVPAGYPTALLNGIVTELHRNIVLPGSASSTLTAAEGQIVTDCAAQQTALTAWNPWAYYGTRYTGDSASPTWIVVNVP